jgi:glutamate N-acetyltransferase/amino-acid N-acetyltransferase
MAAAGYSGAVFDPDKAAMYYNGVPVVVNGMDAGTPEKDLALILRKNSEFELTVDLRAGNASWKVWTNDISYDYVKINAEYHT